MKRNTKLRVRTKFAPELRFELRPSAGGTIRATQETEFEKLRTGFMTGEI